MTDLPHPPVAPAAPLRTPERPVRDARVMRLSATTGADYARRLRDALDDPVRCAALAATGLLDDVQGGPTLARVARLAARALRAPVAQVNLVTRERQTPVALHCEPPVARGAWAAPVGLERSYCQHVVAAGEALAIVDARAHPLVRDSAATRDGGIVAYLAVPLRLRATDAPGGADAAEPTAGSGGADLVLGSVCVVDFVPRAWSADDVALLEDLAAAAGDDVMLRLAARAAHDGAAEATESRYAAILAAAGVAVLGVDAEGRTTFANPEAERILGWSAAELVGRDQHALVHHTRPDGTPYPVGECPVYAARRTGVPTRSEQELFWRRDGTPVPVAFVVTPLGAQGAPSGAVITFEDVSARQAAEAALARALAEASEGRRTLEALLEHIPEGITIADAPDVTIRHVSRYGRQLLERPVEALTGRPAAEHPTQWQVHHAEGGTPARPEELPLTRATAAGETVRNEEWVLRRDDGAMITVLCNAGPIRDGAGRITGGVIAWRDIDARKRRDRRLRLVQELTAALSAAATPEAVADVVLARGGAAVDAGGGLLFLREDAGADAAVDVPTGWVQLVGAHGYDEAETASFRRLPLDTPLPVGAVVREARAAWHGSLSGRAPASPGAAPLAVVPARHAAVACVPLAVRGAAFGALCFDFATPQPFDDETREHLLTVAGLCAQALDRARLFAAERSARAAAERARQEAEGANQAKSHFLSTMSHELRTPLNAIGGYVQLMEMELRGPITAEQRDALERIDRAQRHLLGLINDVLNYARLEARRVEYDVRAIALAEVVRDVTAMVEPQLAARQLTLHVALADGAAPAAGAAPGHVWADREKLAQVLLNLLSNAVKFTAPGGRVAVTLAPVPGRADVVALAVSDTGLGIAPAQQEAVFEPFVQVHRERVVGSQQGTGLGLAISRDLARGMGGELTLTSEPGRGSTFAVLLRRVAFTGDDAGPGDAAP